MKTTLFNKYRKAIIFLALFVGLYIGLNTIYGLYVSAFVPNPDPITYVVANQVVGILSWWYDDLSCTLIDGFASIPLLYNNVPVIYVFEGCNGINVMVVYVTFIIAFRGPLNRTIKFIIVGIPLIYVVNLVRVWLLFEVALKFPDQLYIYHKFFFTGALYCLVFAIWYVWITKANELQSRKS